MHAKFGLISPGRSAGIEVGSPRASWPSNREIIWSLRGPFAPELRFDIISILLYLEIKRNAKFGLNSGGRSTLIEVGSPRGPMAPK